MGLHTELVTSDNSDEESGEAFTDGDFEDSDEDVTVVERNGNVKGLPVNDTINSEIRKSSNATNGGSRENGARSSTRDYSRQSSVNSNKSVFSDSNRLNNNNKGENGITEIRRDSHGDQNPSIVGIIGDQHSHAEQRLAARRAARAEAREIRMRELERQQREQEDHADKAYDMYAGETNVQETVGRRPGPRLAALSPALHSPRRSSEDSVDDSCSLKEMRSIRGGVGSERHTSEIPLQPIKETGFSRTKHELKEVEEKFRKAMILNAQLDNDKAALGYQLELLKDRVEAQREDMAQLQREHKEKCSAYERLKREHLSLERELEAARNAILARDAAAAAAGRAFVEASADAAPELAGLSFGTVPPLALVSADSEQLLNDVGEGTLDVRLQKLLALKQSLESEVRKLKLTLNEERAARQNGVASHHDQEYENELEVVRKSLAEAKARAARAEAEAALQAAGAARLEAQVARLRAGGAAADEREQQLQQERRRLQREAREALNRVEELETENSHLTKRLDKLKNAKSALLKDL